MPSSGCEFGGRTPCTPRAIGTPTASPVPTCFMKYAISLILRTFCNSCSDNLHYVNLQLIDCISIVVCCTDNHTTYGRFRGTSLEWIHTILYRLWFGANIDHTAFRLFQRCCQVNVFDGDGLFVAEDLAVHLTQQPLLSIDIHP